MRKEPNPLCEEFKDSIKSKLRGYKKLSSSPEEPRRGKNDRNSKDESMEAASLKRNFGHTEEVASPPPKKRKKTYKHYSTDIKLIYLKKAERIGNLRAANKMQIPVTTALAWVNKDKLLKSTRGTTYAQQLLGKSKCLMPLTRTTQQKKSRSRSETNSLYSK